VGEGRRERERSVSKETRRRVLVWRGPSAPMGLRGKGAGAQHRYTIERRYQRFLDLPWRIRRAYFRDGGTIAPSFFPLVPPCRARFFFFLLFQLLVTHRRPRARSLAVTDPAEDPGVLEPGDLSQSRRSPSSARRKENQDLSRAISNMATGTQVVSNFLSLRFVNNDQSAINNNIPRFVLYNVRCMTL